VGRVVASEQFGSIAEPVTGSGTGESRWYVVVLDLRTGRMLHKVPTGTPLRPTSKYIGVGNVVALVLKSDGAVAWIAEDYERSTGADTPSEHNYFDVEAVDENGSRLLAPGFDVDLSSLALAVGGSDIGQQSTSRPGAMVYWSQGDQVQSAPLN
jgi:hypothetical protein